MPFDRKEYERKRALTRVRDRKGEYARLKARRAVDPELDTRLRERTRALARMRYQSNPSLYRERSRIWHQKNRDVLRERIRARRKSDPAFRAKLAEYKRRNKDRVNADTRRYYWRHREELIAKRSAYQRFVYRPKNRKVLDAKNSEYRRRNWHKLKERYVAYQKKSNAKVLPSYVARVIERDSGIPRHKVPANLIAAKREQLLIKRLLKEMK